MITDNKQNVLGMWRKMLGVETSPVSRRENLISAVGGFLAILGILLVNSRFTELPDATLLVASMGASAVSLFAVPHGQLAQPWPLAGGHIISATVGFSCALLISDKLLAASLAVGLAIFAMHYLIMYSPSLWRHCVVCRRGWCFSSNLGLLVCTHISGAECLCDFNHRRFI